MVYGDLTKLQIGAKELVQHFHAYDSLYVWQVCEK